MDAFLAESSSLFERILAAEDAMDGGAVEAILQQASKLAVFPACCDCLSIGGDGASRDAGSIKMSMCGGRSLAFLIDRFFLFKLCSIRTRDSRCPFICGPSLSKLA